MVQHVLGKFEEINVFIGTTMKSQKLNKLLHLKLLLSKIIAEFTAP